MRIENLKIKNIGPFKSEELRFYREKEDGSKEYPIVIITGENGTGKSIIIDSIRGNIKSLFGINRDIVADKDDFEISVDLFFDNQKHEFKCTKLQDGKLSTRNNNIFGVFLAEKPPKVNWIIDYWTPILGTDGFTISNLSPIDTDHPLRGALDGVNVNVELTKFICSVDYLRNSDNKSEADKGRYVYNILKKIINDCLGKDAQFSHVQRSSLKPIIKINNQEISLDKLSSGNILLVEHFVRLIYRLYCICENCGKPINEMCSVEGVLLIDEIENHLHPKWQKSVIGIIKKYFPNLQIILTTHSPYVVSSVEDPIVYVCESQIECSTVKFVQESYYNKPVDEVLNATAFKVGPFNSEVSELLSKRKKAIAEGNTVQVSKIEKQLIKLNEEYFSFYSVAGKTVFYEK